MRRAVIVESYPDQDQQVGGVADKPGIPVIAGRTCFSCAGKIHPQSLQNCRCAFLNDALENVGDDKALRRRCDGHHFDVSLLLLFTGFRDDFLEAEQVGLLPIVVKISVSTAELHRGHFKSSQCKRGVGFERRRDAQLAQRGDDVFHSHRHGQADCGCIQRLFESGAKRHLSLVAAVVVFGSPRFAANGVRPQLIRQPTGWREFIQSA